MRELNIEEVEQVSGGTLTEALGLWGSGLAIGAATYGSSWGAVSALVAIGISPIGGLAMVGLAFAGGYQLLQD